MQSLWSDADAERLVERYAQQGIGRDLALRVYTSRLLGGEPKLVLHGGGNTSVKTIVKVSLTRRSRCCASRAAAGTWRRSSPRVSPPFASPRCANCGSERPSRTRKWCASSAPT